VIRILNWLVVILIPPFLLLSNLYLLMSPRFMDYQYSKGLPPAPRFDEGTRRELARETLRYVTSSQDISVLRVLADEEGSLYNERELSHLVDVKTVAHQAFLAHGLMGATLLITIVALLAKKRPVAPPLLHGSLLTLALFALGGIFIAVNFNTFFLLFHRVLFRGDSWMFSLTDTLIQLFPLPFWSNAALTWVGLTLGEALVLGLGAYLSMRKR
jgi:integral membrane protein (TIGR01906 family)